jgi:hypothetical protein
MSSIKINFNLPVIGCYSGQTDGSTACDFCVSSVQTAKHISGRKLEKLLKLITVNHRNNATPIIAHPIT